MPEYWDICDENGIPTGRIHQKGMPMNPGEYHMSVSVWIRNRKGEYLISRRLPTARHDPNFWEPAGGSAIAGEDSLAAALREVREELGLTLDPACGTLFRRYNWPHSDGCGMVHICTWVFRSDASLADITLQPEETCDARWASEDEIRVLIREGLFVPYDYLDALFAYCRSMCG
ncbi:MAG: NUDIX domain-containing protein [Clostridia bacterium]|nr:NUDIX domain-containing protein [Clostridia bacterium]